MDAVQGRCEYECLYKIKENLKQDALIFNNTLVLFRIGFNREALRTRSSGRMPLWMI